MDKIHMILHLVYVADLLAETRVTYFLLRQTPKSACATSPYMQNYAINFLETCYKLCELCELDKIMLKLCSHMITIY